MQPHRRQPTRLPRPWIFQARTLEWVAISFSNAWKWKVKVKSLSHVQLLATPWTAAYQTPLSMGFSRQNYWSGVPVSSLKARARHCFYPTINTLNCRTALRSLLAIPVQARMRILYLVESNLLSHHTAVKCIDFVNFHLKKNWSVWLIPLNALASKFRLPLSPKNC